MINSLSQYLVPALILNNNLKIVSVNDLFNELYGGSNAGLLNLSDIRIFRNESIHGEAECNHEIVISLISNPSLKYIFYLVLTSEPVNSYVAFYLNKRPDNLSKKHHLDSLGQLTGTLAHKFHNLIGSILGYSELIKMSNQDSLVNENLEPIITSAERASEITRKLLSFARHSDLGFELLDLKELIITCINQIRNEHSDLKISFNNLEKIEDSFIFGGRLQLYQLFFELFKNTYDFKDSESPEININLKLITKKSSDSGTHLYWRITYEDNSIGVPFENQHRIFDPFFSTKEVVGSSCKSVGLGLSSVFGITRAHFGSICPNFSPYKKKSGLKFEIDLLKRIDKNGQDLIKHMPQRLKNGQGIVYIFSDNLNHFNFKALIFEILGYQVYYYPKSFNIILKLLQFEKTKGAIVIIDSGSKESDVLEFLKTKSLVEIINKNSQNMIVMGEFQETINDFNEKVHFIKSDFSLIGIYEILYKFSTTK